MSSLLSLSEMTSILDSAFEHLVSTNEPPSEPEATEVRSLLKELQVRIVELPRYHVVLDAERRDLQRCLSAHQAILSPVRRVPAEVLMQIFSYTTEDAYDVQRVESGPWVLTHACRTWRAVALACPELWTSLLLPWENLQPHITGSLHLLDMALSRSKERPLSITFTPERATPGVKFFYQRLLREAQCWKNARIYIPNNVYDCFTRLEGGLSNLETLDLVIDLNKAHKEAPTFFAAFESAPRLHDVTVSGTPPLSAGLLPDVQLPWKQMRRFCTEHICSIDHLLQILTNTPHLRDLELLCLKWHYPKHAEALGVHESVRTLRLWDPRLLDYLVLPAIESIELELGEKDRYASALGRFVRRSECAPRKLVLRNGRPSERLEALKAAPTLEHLVLDEGFHGRENVETLFKMLTWGPESASLLPRLAHFEWIADISSFQFDGDCLLDMIESRWKVAEGSAVAPLRSVKAACRAWRSKLSRSSLRRLEQLKKDGLDIQISFNDFSDNHPDRTWLF